MSVGTSPKKSVLLRLVKWPLLCLALALLGTGGVAWVERDELRAWWALRGLCQADDSQREAWAARVAELSATVEGLLDCLSSPDDRARQNTAFALCHLARSWGSDDARTADLAAELARGCGRCGPAGRACLLESMAGWLDDKPPSPALVVALARLLDEAAGAEDEALGGALELGLALLQKPQTGDAVRPAREAARAGLRSPSAENRLRAVRMGLLPGVDLLKEIAGLLRDPDVEVRRAAVVAVGPSKDPVSDDTLLPCLHDPDEQVRELAEQALLGRGLKPFHIALGKLVTHPKARVRVHVLDYLDDESVPDVGIWLRRLSHDESPAVRAAAVRMMSEQALAHLQERIEQMASDDPSPTVAQLARFYLHRNGRPMR